MRDYDPTTSLSVFAIVIGLVAGIAVGVLLDFSTLGVLVTAIVGVLLAGFVASALGIVGEKDRGQRTDDLPSEYHDY